MSGGAPPTQSRRLHREFMELAQTDFPGIHLNISKIDAEGNGNTWFVTLDGTEDSLYAGEKFELQLRFGSRYPFESPEVIFVGPNIPIHPHVYGNGHICLSILADDWTPAMTAFSLCISILSMLSSCTTKEPPKDNDDYVLTHRHRSPKQTAWAFHDNTV